MKKHILYITVAEFLENGGELEGDRQLYDQSGNYSGWVHPEPEILEPAQDDMLWCRRINCTSLMSKNTIYVEVKATPIYE